MACKDHSTKDWLELTKWFLKRRFLCEFPIGFYIKLGSAVGAILVEGQNRWSHFWKRTIQWLWMQFKKKCSPLKLLSQIQPNFAEMILGWSPSNIKSNISDLRPRWPSHFWKRTIQWLFHQNLVLIEQMVSDKKIFMGISHTSYVCSPLKLLSQSQTNFAEMIFGWFSSKIVSGILDLRPRWPQQPNLI
jgi:hypothetical protein